MSGCTTTAGCIAGVIRGVFGASCSVQDAASGCRGAGIGGVGAGGLVTSTTTPGPTAPEAGEAPGVEDPDPGQVSVMTDSPATAELPSVPEPPDAFTPTGPPSPPPAADAWLAFAKRRSA